MEFFELKVSSWSLKLLIVIAIWSWNFKSQFLVKIWGWKLNFEAKAWCWSLRLNFEVEVWSWSLKLQFEVEVWSLNLKFELNFKAEIRVSFWSRAKGPNWIFFPQLIVQRFWELVLQFPKKFLSLPTHPEGWEAGRTSPRGPGRPLFLHSFLKLNLIFLPPYVVLNAHFGWFQY